MGGSGAFLLGQGGPQAVARAAVLPELGKLRLGDPLRVLAALPAVVVLLVIGAGASPPVPDGGRGSGLRNTFACPMELQRQDE